jgi:hypothetical protein
VRLKLSRNTKIRVLLSAKLQVIEYSDEIIHGISKIAEGRGWNGCRLEVERWRYDALVGLADRGQYFMYVGGHTARQGAYIRFLLDYAHN